MDIESNEIIFENEKSNNAATYKLRRKKFSDLLDSVRGVDGLFRQTMNDLFPKIEAHFIVESERKNFINLNQLARVMCVRIGYPEHQNKFKCLKIKARIKQIEQFVDEAIGHSGNNIRLMALKDLPLISYDVSPTDDPKVPNLCHTYNDIRNASQTNKNKKAKG